MHRLTISFLLSAAVLAAGFFLPSSTQAATATGTMVSAVKDMSLPADFGLISWTASTSASSTLAVKVRTATTSDMSSAPDWADCDAVVSGTDISLNNCVDDNRRYLQYQVYFECDYASTSTFAAPEMSEIEIEYVSKGTVVSSVYDTGADDNILTGLSWTESRPDGSDVFAQIRTSADGLAWSEWLGPTGADDYYTDPDGGETINAAHADGADDQFFQYKIYLDSAGTGLPVVEDITVAYSALVPVIASISPNFAEDNSVTTSVAITGSEFGAGSTVLFTSFGQALSPANVVISGTDRITCDLPVPAAFGGLAEVRVTNANGAYATSSFWIKKQVGHFDSVAGDLGAKAWLETLAWTASTTASSSIAIRVRTADNSSMTGAPDWTACDVVSSGADISTHACVSPAEQFFQYRAEFTAEFPAEYIATSSYILPGLHDITLTYNYYASGTLISTPYDTQDNASALTRLAWNDTAPAGTAVRVQIRTAPDTGSASGVWTAWLGPNGEDSYYTSASGVLAINLAHNDGTNDRWLQYKIYLTGGQAQPPAVYDLTLEYGAKTYSQTTINNGTIFKGDLIIR